MNYPHTKVKLYSDQIGESPAPQTGGSSFARTEHNRRARKITTVLSKKTKVHWQSPLYPYYHKIWLSYKSFEKTVDNWIEEYKAFKEFRNQKLITNSDLQNFKFEKNIDHIINATPFVQSALFKSKSNKNPSISTSNNIFKFFKLNNYFNNITSNERRDNYKKQKTARPKKKTKKTKKLLVKKGGQTVNYKFFFIGVLIAFIIFVFLALIILYRSLINTEEFEELQKETVRVEQFKK